MQKILISIMVMLLFSAAGTNCAFADENAKNISVDLSSAKVVGSADGRSNTSWSGGGDDSYVFNYNHVSKQCWAETEFQIPEISGDDYYAIKITMRIIEADKDGTYNPWFGVFRNEAHTSADYCWMYHTGFEYTTKCIGDGNYYTYYIPTQSGKGDFHFNWSGETINKLSFRWFFNASGILNVKSIELICGPEITEMGYNGLLNVDTSAVPTDITSIELYLSEAITQSSVNENTVKLYDEQGALTALKTEYNPEEKKLVIYPEGKLKKNKNYTLMLYGIYGIAKDTVTAQIKHPITAEFKTEPDIYNVESVKFTDISPQEEGADVTVSNNSKEDKNFLIVMSAWSGDMFIKNKIIRLAVPKNSKNEASVTLDGLETGNSIEIYVIDNESDIPKLISDEVYKTNF